MKKVLLMFTVVLCSSFAVAEVKLWNGIVIPDANLQSAGYYSINSLLTGVGVETDILRYKALSIAPGYLQTPGKGIYLTSLKLNLNKLNELGVPINFLWSNWVNTSIGIWTGYSPDSALRPEDRWSYGVMACIIKVGN